MQVADYVRTKAYHRFMERGGHHGEDFNDWLEAERQVPKRVLLGYRPKRRQEGGFDYCDLEPGIANWEDLYQTSRFSMGAPRDHLHVSVSIAWIDDSNAPNTNGETNDELSWDRNSPFPFPEADYLAAKGVTLAFHGPVLIRWDLSTTHGFLNGITFRFLRHPDTCCEEIPRISRTSPFRCSGGKILDFVKGEPWSQSRYNRTGL